MDAVMEVHLVPLHPVASAVFIIYSRLGMGRRWGVLLAKRSRMSLQMSNLKSQTSTMRNCGCQLLHTLIKNLQILILGLEEEDFVSPELDPYGDRFCQFPMGPRPWFLSWLCLCQQHTFTWDFIQFGLLPLLTTMFAKFLWTRESVVMKRMDSRAKLPSFKFWPCCLISCVALNKALNFSASLLTPSQCHLDINCNYDFDSVCEDRDRQVLSRCSVVRVSQKPTTETTTRSLTGP